MSPAGTLRVATWNVHGCVGRDGVRDVLRTARAVRGLGADIVALQELDSRYGGEDVFDMLSAAVGPHAVGARTLRGPEGDYGHLLASRMPCDAPYVYDVSAPGREPRQIIETRVVLPGGERLAVFAVHLDLRARARRAQLAQLRRLVEAAAPLAAIALGDFNLAWGASAVRSLGGVLWPVPAPATFPARCPVLRLDRIWCRPPGLIRAAAVPADADRSASDHLPLVADLDLELAVSHAR